MWPRGAAFWGEVPSPFSIPGGGWGQPQGSLSTSSDLRPAPSPPPWGTHTLLRRPL